MSIKLTDMDQVEAKKGGLMLPVGTHTVTIEAAEEGESRGGFPQVEMKFANDLGDIRDWIVFAPSKQEGLPSFAMQKAKQLLEAVEIAPEGGEWEFPTDKLAGKRLIIRVGEEPDNRGETNEDGSPKMRRRVYDYFAANGGSDIPGDTADLGKATVVDDKKLPF